MAKKKCPEFENHERWLVSYADMLTLLFAVFVTLYALNLSEEPKPTTNDQAAGSMQESFNTPLADIPVERRVGPTEAGYGIFEHMRGNSAKPTINEKYPNRDQQAHIIDSEMNKISLQIDERLYGPQKFQGSKKAGEERIVDIKRTEDGFKLQLYARHFYDAGAVDMRRSALKELDDIIKIIKKLGRDITVQGHTDATPPAGAMSNWDLSALRATHLLRYLISQHNYPPTRLSAAGFADTKPIAHNGTEQGRRLNRRVEIHVNYSSEYESDSGS